MRPIPNTNEISTFLHCKQCMEELPSGVSMRNFADYEIGYTEIGLQIWCKRHDCNIIHIDFEGLKHPANLSRKAEGVVH